MLRPKFSAYTHVKLPSTSHQSFDSSASSSSSVGSSAGSSVSLNDLNLSSEYQAILKFWQDVVKEVMSIKIPHKGLRNYLNHVNTETIDSDDMRDFLRYKHVCEIDVYFLLIELIKRNDIALFLNLVSSVISFEKRVNIFGKEYYSEFISSNQDLGCFKPFKKIAQKINMWYERHAHNPYIHSVDGKLTLHKIAAVLQGSEWIRKWSVQDGGRSFELMVSSSILLNDKALFKFLIEGRLKSGEFYSEAWITLKSKPNSISHYLLTAQINESLWKEYLEILKENKYEEKWFKWNDLKLFIKDHGKLFREYFFEDRIDFYTLRWTALNESADLLEHCLSKKLSSKAIECTLKAALLESKFEAFKIILEKSELSSRALRNLFEKSMDHKSKNRNSLSLSRYNYTALLFERIENPTNKEYMRFLKRAIKNKDVQSIEQAFRHKGKPSSRVLDMSLGYALEEKSKELVHYFVSHGAKLGRTTVTKENLKLLPSNYDGYQRIRRASRHYLPSSVSSSSSASETTPAASSASSDSTPSHSVESASSTSSSNIKRKY